ncbi:DUF4136 domain-containing protein [Qipengyuania aquimaris]|uniref:DUF4136 domain-containing protein n=1 Tax=Qipengyuania aquimaris TaxID=255984 RepID=UPI001FCFF49C|nr:DUF4136 domain-containing protein [Qipengyuania aquimaris]UOR15788.1 DUF4136 domain-containing protein [Qipengyuania aquimaris]
MMKYPTLISAALATLALGACATPPGPVEVTRFVAPESVERLGEGTIFIESAAGEDNDSLMMAPYKSAIAEELRSLGYTESDRASASQIATVSVERYVLEAGGRRSPVSVGVGGSTGTYGSGVGVGIGINLGGGERDKLGTMLAVTIRDADTSQSLWEGRADFRVKDNSPLARSNANAQTVAAALFSDFPGNNGETIEVEVSE